MMEMPPLPEPDGTATVVTAKVDWPNGLTGDVEEYIPAWSEPLVREYGESCARMAREEAAKVAESFATCPCNGDRGPCRENDPPRAIAAAIRKG